MPQNKQMKMQWVTIDGRNVPFVLPQIWDETKQDWIVTSDTNPLPTKDDLLLNKINELNNKVDGIIDGSTPANTQLTGSIEVIYLVDALAITSTSHVYYDNAFRDVGDYSKKSIYIINTLNQPVDIYLRAGQAWGFFWSEGEYKNVAVHPATTIPSNFRGYVGGDLLKVINENIFTVGANFGFALKCDEPPTSGSITIRFIGGN